MRFFLPRGVYRGGFIAAAGKAQTVAQANRARRDMTFQNTSDTEMRLAEDGQDASATRGYIISPGNTAEITTSERVSVWCSAAGKTFEATEN